MNMNKLSVIMLFAVAKAMKPCFGPDEDAAIEAAKVATEKAASEKIYTKAEMDAVAARQRKTYEAENRKTADALKAFQEKANLTEAERDAATERIQMLEKTYMTQTELADRNAKAAEAMAKKDKETLTAERDAWKTRFTKSTIEQKITAVAVAGKALVPAQVIKELKDATRLVEELDSTGKPTGNLVPQVSFEDVDAQGKPITLALSVEDTVKRMKELPQRYGNLFAADGAGGLGQQNRNPGGQQGALPTDTDAYMSQRRADRKAGN